MSRFEINALRSSFNAADAMLVRRAPWVCQTCRHHGPSASRTYSTAATRQRPIHVAIIGSGPAGFYSAYRLLKKLPDARIDMFEHLPVPYGLVRYGVAPDHPDVKVCFICTAWHSLPSINILF